MKRALGYLIFGMLAIGAVYVSVTRISPFLSAQESGTGVADTVEPPTIAPPPTLMPSPTILPPTPVPPTIAPPTAIPPPTLAPSPTFIPPTETLVPTTAPVTEVIMPTQIPPTEVFVATSAPTTEVLVTEATATVEMIVSTEILPTSEPTVDTAAPTDVLPTAVATDVLASETTAPVVTRGDGSSSMPVSNGAQLSLGTPMVQPPAPPTVTLEVIQSTTMPVDAQLTLVPTVVLSPTPARAQITGTISAPLAANLVLTLPDGTTMNATTAPDGTFAFGNLLPGNYLLQASADGFLTSQVEFSLSDGQSLALPPVALRGGDTNRDNVIDVRDAVLIAANFGGPAIAPETDLNRDGMIDIRDLTILGAVFGQSGPTPWG